MSHENQLIYALIYLIIMVLLAYFFKKYPPKKINMLYGYRTNRSMSNQEIWEAANTYSSTIFFKWQLYTLAVPLLLYFVLPDYVLMGSLIVHIIVILAVLPATEIYLNKHFDKKGNPK